MLLLFFFCMALAQIISYLLMDQYRVVYGRLMVLIVLLAGHLLIFPHLTAPPPPTADEGYVCGLSVFVHYLVFWVIGGGGSLLIHLLYYFLYRMRRRDGGRQSQQQ